LNKKDLLIGISFALIGAGLLLYKLRLDNIYRFGDFSDIKIELPDKLSIRECNTTYMKDRKKWLKTSVAADKKKSQNRKLEQKSDIFVKKDSIFIKNKEFRYIGDIREKSLYAIFKTKEDDKTVFIKAKRDQKLPDSDIVLVENSSKRLVFLDKNGSKYTIEKNYIEIKKYQKDVNETKK